MAPSNSKLIAELMNNNTTIDADAIPNGSGVSIGTIVPFAGTAAPTGFLSCDGAAIDRTVYADLYTAIGDTWGSGDGSTTFNIPDLRNRFIRGSSSSRAVGVSENEGLRKVRIVSRATYGNAENGDLVHFRVGTDTWNPGGGGEFTLGVAGKESGGPLGGVWANWLETDPGNASLNTSEVRPTNKVTLYCIKY